MPTFIIILLGLLVGFLIWLHKGYDKSSEVADTVDKVPKGEALSAECNLLIERLKNKENRSQVDLTGLMKLKTGEGIYLYEEMFKYSNLGFSPTRVEKLAIWMTIQKLNLNLD